jgi:heme-degrading monooxygenase HmoA
MIARHWRGLTTVADAKRYVAYLRQETFPHLSTIPGFVDATVLQRTTDRGVEFLVVTTWQSMAAVKRFAGPKGDIAVVPQRVREMMLEYDEKVTLYEVIETTGKS